MKAEVKNGLCILFTISISLQPIPSQHFIVKICIKVKKKNRGNQPPLCGTRSPCLPVSATTRKTLQIK